MIGLADPRNQRPVGGTGRIVIQDAKWQTALLALLEYANVVFIQYERGGSLEWEVAHFLSQRDRPTIVWIDRITLPHALPSDIKRSMHEAGLTPNAIDSLDGRSVLIGIAGEHRSLRIVEPRRGEFARCLKGMIRELSITSVPAARHRPHAPLTVSVVLYGPFVTMIAAVALGVVFLNLT